MPESLEAAIAAYLPRLMLPQPTDDYPDKGRRPVDVHEYLKHVPLRRIVDGQVTELMASITPQDQLAFLDHCAADPEHTYVSATVMDATDPALTTDDAALVDLYGQVGPKFPAYVSAFDSALALLQGSGAPAEVSEATQQLLAEHAVLSYSFFFPVQDGAGVSPPAAVSSHEGAWMAFSVLLDKAADFAARWAGFQGATATLSRPRGIRVVPWEEVEKIAAARNGLLAPKAFVARGTHSLFERTGVFESWLTATAEFSLDETEDGDIIVEVEGSPPITFESGPSGLAAAGALVLGLGLKTGNPWAIGAGIAMLLAALIWWLLTCGDDDDSSGGGGSGSTGTGTGTGTGDGTEDDDDAVPTLPNPAAVDEEEEEDPFAPAEQWWPPFKLREEVPPQLQEATPSGAWNAQEQFWWAAACAWGTLDVEHPEMERVTAGRPRADLAQDFVRTLAEKLDES